MKIPGGVRWAVSLNKTLSFNNILDERKTKDKTMQRETSVIKSRNITWTKHIARLATMRNA
jgi:hypothetical protein